MKKKFLALLLAFVMAAGMLPMTALAEEARTPDVVKAPLGDTASKYTSEQLNIAGYTVEAAEDAESTDETVTAVYDVTVTHPALLKHKNAASPAAEGLWVGIGVPISTKGTGDEAGKNATGSSYFAFITDKTDFSEIATMFKGKDWAGQGVAGYSEYGWRSNDGTHVFQWYNVADTRYEGKTPYLVERNPVTDTEAKTTAYTYNVYRITFDVTEGHLVTITEPTNGTLTVKAGGKDVSTGTPVGKGTELTITATPSGNYKVSKVKIGETALTAQDDGSYKYTVADADVTISAEFAPVPTFTAVTGTETLYGKQISALQDGVTIAKSADGKYVISGTLKKVTDAWTEFNGTYVPEQTGYYVAISVPKTVGEKTVAGMILHGHDADGQPVEKKYEGTDAINGVFNDSNNSACYVVTHVGAADATVSAVKNKEFTISLKYGDDADYTDYTFVCSGVTPEGAAADPTPVTPPSGGGSTGGGSNTTTTTNPDGSTTTKTEDKATGTVTETTKKTDGSTTVVETKKDGTVTTTDTDAEGNKTATVAKPDGSSETKVSNTDGSTSTTTVDTQGQVKAEVKLTDKAVEAADSAPVALPMPEVPVTTDRENAPTVTVSLPGGSESVKVEIPVENVTPGSVAVIVKADGTEEVVKTSVTTENGVAVTLSDGDTVKIVDNSKQFDDVPASHWGSDAVGFASSRELFNGTSETTFSPDTVMTRGMLVTVLARFDGADTSGGNTWYDKGVEWAVANNISDGSYPHYNITREQMITMLWRYAGSPAASGTIDSYTDAGSVSSYSVDAMNWAVSTGLISGTGNNSLSPQGNATRAQVAALLMHYVELLAAK